MKTKRRKKSAEREIPEGPLSGLLAQEYPAVLTRDPDGGFVAEIVELPGCLSQGESVEEALENLGQARRLWLEVAYEAGDEIPPPSTDESYSGRLLLRLPQGLHRRLAATARLERVSLNQWILARLAETLGSGELRRIEGKVDRVLARLEAAPTAAT